MASISEMEADLARSQYEADVRLKIAKVEADSRVEVAKAARERWWKAPERFWGSVAVAITIVIAGGAYAQNVAYNNGYNALVEQCQSQGDRWGVTVYKDGNGEIKLYSEECMKR